MFKGFIGSVILESHDGTVSRAGADIHPCDKLERSSAEKSP